MTGFKIRDRIQYQLSSVTVPPATRMSTVYRYSSRYCTSTKLRTRTELVLYSYSPLLKVESTFRQLIYVFFF